jgi:serine protease
LSAAAIAVSAAIACGTVGAADDLSVVLMMKADVDTSEARRLRPADHARLERLAGADLVWTGSTRTNAQILKLPREIKRNEAERVADLLSHARDVLWAELSVSGANTASDSRDTSSKSLGRGQQPGSIRELIIRFRDSSIQDGGASNDKQLATLAAAAGIGLAPVRESAAGWIYRLANPVDRAQAREIEQRLEKLPAVMYADPVVTKRAQSTGPLITPNDARFPQMWFLLDPADFPGSANVQAAWSLTRGSPDVTVAVLDTGVLFAPTHPDLADRLIYLTEDHTRIAGWDLVRRAGLARDGNARDRNPKDEGDWVTARLVRNNEACDDNTVSGSTWHGSHVAGTIAAATDNGIGISGIDWHARLLPVRIMGACGAVSDDEFDGIYWAVGGKAVPGTRPNRYPAHLLNLSIGGESPCSDAEQAAIDFALARNSVVVVAAGNDQSDAGKESPANCHGVITVAALDRFGNLAWYSNFGSVVAIAAPGGDTQVPGDGVLSTVNRSARRPDPERMGYENQQGTSMATPVVTGVVALMLAADTGHKLAPQSIKSILQSTARPFPKDTRCDNELKGLCGAGIVDAHRAVEAVQRLQ